MISMMLSCCCRNLDLDDDDVEEDEEKAELAEEALWNRRSRRQDNSEFYPIDEMFLVLLRRERIKEVEMQSVVKEIIAYAFFIMIVYFISYGNRDTMSYKLQAQMTQTFVIEPGYDKIVTSNDWWDWCHKTAVNGLRAQSFYNGMPPYGLRGFIGDKTNRILGYGVLRQIRVQPNTCRVDKRVHNITQECAQVFSLIILTELKDPCGMN